MNTVIILRPLINEKSMLLTKDGLYTFEVAKQSSKEQIKKAVSSKFGVDVLAVNTITISGKKKMQRARRRFYLEPSIKKAVVQVKKGQKIAIFEKAGQEEEQETQEVEVKTAEGEVIAKTKEKKSLFGRTKVKVEQVKKEEKK